MLILWLGLTSPFSLILLGFVTIFLRSGKGSSQLIENINQTLGKFNLPQQKLEQSNKLILSIMISNGNANTKPVELLLHFIITEDETTN